jgi:hypothetical protein
MRGHQLDVQLSQLDGVWNAECNQLWMALTRLRAGHRAWVVALESFAFPISPFEDSAFAEEGKIAVTTAMQSE